MYTADPRVVPLARKLDVMSYDEMLELASSGARVLQLRSVEFARNHGVPLHVRSSFSDGEGTWVVAKEDGRMLERAMISGVAHTVDETVYRVEGVSAATLFSALAHARVNVDTILQTGEEIVVSAPAENRAATARTLEALQASWSMDAELGKVTVVGAGMRSHLSVHVRRDDVERAVHALHHAFGLEVEERAGA